MKALVTGGAGFIGSHVCQALQAAGHRVEVVDSLVSGRRENLPPNCPLHEMDIADPALDQVLAGGGFEVVFHLAAQTDVTASIRDPLTDARSNVLGSLRLLESCRRHEVAKVIYASSCAAVGEPQCLPVDEAHPLAAISPYGISKQVVENYLFYYGQVHGLAYTALRYSNVYGPRQDAGLEGGVVAIFSQRLLAGRECTIFGDGEQTRDFVYVGDVAAANLAAADLGAGPGKVINISSGRPTSVNAIYRLLARRAGRDKPARYAQARPGEVRGIYLDNSLAQRELGWRPQTDLDQGLAATLEWHRHNQG